MENMEDFEGIKRIKNTNNFSIEFIYNCLKQYEKAIGTVELEANTIIADVAGKYEIEIFLNNDSIVVQRRIEEGKKEDKINFGEELKSVDMSQADRMVEQIYDFLKTLSIDGKSKEPITGVKKIFYVKQKEGTFRNAFTVTTENGEEVYEIKGNKILKEFVVNNIKAKRKDVTIQFENYEQGKFTIVKSPYTVVKLQKQEDIKNLFTAKVDGKKIEVRADYSGNHYQVEVKNIVVGAIDSLNDKTKDSYRIEINSLDYEYLIVALTVIVDLDYEI